MTGARRGVFLVECYIPDGDPRAVALATQGHDRPGGGPRHLGTVVVAAEQTCLSVFEADDAAEVVAATAAAGLPLDRIVEAEWFPGSPG